MKQANFNPLLAHEIEGCIIDGKVDELKAALEKEGAGDAVRHPRSFSARNLLQIAVCSLKPEAVRAILDTEAGREIINRKDGAGQTALDITYNFNAASADLCDEIRGILKDAGAKRAKDLPDIKLQPSFYSRHNFVCNLFLCTAAFVIGVYVGKNPSIIISNLANLGDFCCKCLLGLLLLCTGGTVYGAPR